MSDDAAAALGLATGETAPEQPDLPEAVEVDLGDLGRLPVKHLRGPAGAPTVVLLHGWTATADLNWFRCYAGLAEHVGVIAYDHRGHNSGLRTRKPFRLDDCADDAIRVADALGVEQIIPVGYSMGGPVAQLVWRRHPERTRGLVLCATAPYFAGTRPERLSFVGLTGLAAVARFTPAQARNWITDQVYLQRKNERWGSWATEQVANHDWRMILEAGREIGEFSSSDWVGEIDVPTSVVVTMDDPVVPLRRQTKLWEWIPGATVFRVGGGHDAVVANSRRFVPTLVRAIAAAT